MAIIYGDKKLKTPPPLSSALKISGALTKLTRKSNAELAAHLRMNSNKLYHNSFSVADLIKIASFSGCALFSLCYIAAKGKFYR